jgi:hypothetical protein
MNTSHTFRGHFQRQHINHSISITMARFSLILVLLSSSEAYPGGAGSCSGPSNGHGSVAAGNGGYTLAVGSAMAGGSATVTVSGGSFKGFLVKSSLDFSSPPSGTKYMNCGGGQRGLTHSTDVARSSMATSMSVPFSATGDLTVTAYIVKSRWEHYLLTESVTITAAVATDVPSAAPTFAPTVPTAAPTEAPTNEGDTHTPTNSPTISPTVHDHNSHDDHDMDEGSGAAAAHVLPLMWLLALSHTIALAASI